MAITIASLFTLYRFTPGRRAWMLTRIRALAVKFELSTIVERCDALLPAEEQLAQDLRAWTEVRSDVAATETSRALVGLDQARDGLLGDFFTALQALARLSGRKSGRAAARLIAKLFPEGSRKIITLPYPDETAAIEALLKLATGELTADVTDANAGEWVEDLGQANTSFKATYDSLTAKRQVDWKEIRAKDAAAQDLFLVLLCHVVDTSFGKPVLADLLDPVEVQQQAMKALFQSRRAVVDIDPKTGDDLSEPVASGPATPNTPS